MQAQPFENCPDVPCLITAILKPEPAKVIRLIPVASANKSISIPVVHMSNDALSHHA